MTYTPEQALSFAPSDKAATRARSTAKLAQWQYVRTDGRAAWGMCKQYEVQVDVQGPAFKCSCPSREIPCKHGVALLLMHARGEAQQVDDAARPDWVATWMAKRELRRPVAATHATQADPEAEHKKEEARDKRRQERLQEMVTGAGELRNFLEDMMRQGLAQLEERDATYWQDIAARMVDRKLGAFNRRLRELQLLVGSGPEWHVRVMEAIADLYLTIQALERYEQLPKRWQATVRAAAGITVKKSEVLAQPGITDTWLIVGQLTLVNIDNAEERRTWLQGASTGRYVRLVEYNYMSSGFGPMGAVGDTLQGEVCYYPAAYALRGLLRDGYTIQSAVSGVSPMAAPTFAAALDGFATATAQSPWVGGYPMTIAGVLPTGDTTDYRLIDREGTVVPCVAMVLEDQFWNLMALSGGQPLTVFGVWTIDNELRVLAVLHDEGMQAV